MFIIILKIYCLLNVFTFIWLAMGCIISLNRIEKTSSFEDYRDTYEKDATREQYDKVKSSNLEEMMIGSLLLSFFSPIMSPAIIIGIFRRIIAFLTKH